MQWPTDEERLAALQRDLAGRRPDPWVPDDDPAIGGCFVCFGRGGSGPGEAGDLGWAAAGVVSSAGPAGTAVVVGRAGAPYRSGLLAAREGMLLAGAVQALPHPPSVLLVNATGRDHPRRAGLALHLGWTLDLPTVGVTHRPLLAEGPPPGPAPGDRSPLTIDDEPVGWWLRTRRGARPLAVTPAWRTDLESAAAIVLRAGRRARTPEPLRLARRAARTARSRGTHPT